MIEARGLTKVYRVPVKEPGLAGSIRALVHRRTKDVVAVDHVSFEIAAGERVGFLGPNGAGKTTTLKMLTGLLHPTEGEARVAGHRPQDRARDFLQAVTLVMGQKRQLLWDLPAVETFALNQALFGIPDDVYRLTLAELTDLLDLADFLDQPVRNLSLGQRMRCEIAAALLHRPRVLFLDEPTIGLDVEVQAVVRDFIKAYNERNGATVMLTSHDMHDVAAIARRILLIDEGRVVFDGSLPELSRRFGTGRRVVVQEVRPALEAVGMRVEEGRMVATVPADEVNALLQAVLHRDPAATVTVEDPPLEQVLRRAFGEGA